MAWDHRSYGSKSDPIRQSDLGAIAAAYSCPKQFAYRKGDTGRGPSSRAYGAQVIGTAVHEVIHRVLGQYQPDDGLPEVPADEHLERAIRQEILREAAGRDIVWSARATLDSEVANALVMTRGALEHLRDHAARILVHEASFAVRIETKGGRDPYWLTGTIDMVYVDREGRLILADWKTGARVPSPIVMDHGYQLAIYAHALAEGVFFDAKDREQVDTQLGGDNWDTWAEEHGQRIGEYPDALYLVYLRDYLTYEKNGPKTGRAVKRVEEAEYYGVQVGDKIVSQKGDRKGPAWYRSKRTPEDVARLKVSLTTIVGTIRLGRFVEHLGEPCEKCPYTSQCLTQGYAAVEGDAAREMERALKGIDTDGLEDLEDAAQ